MSRVDIAVDHRLVGYGAVPALPVSGGRHRAELLDVLAEEGAAEEHHLEAVIVGRIVAAGDHDAAVHGQLGLGEIEHRRRPEPDPHHIDAAFGQAADQRRLQLRRAGAAVAADRDRAAAGAPDQGAEAAPDRLGIVRPQGFADHAADVIFAQGRRVESMTHRETPFRTGA